MSSRGHRRGNVRSHPYQGRTGAGRGAPPAPDSYAPPMHDGYASSTASSYYANQQPSSFPTANMNASYPGGGLNLAALNQMIAQATSSQPLAPQSQPSSMYGSQAAYTNAMSVPSYPSSNHSTNPMAPMASMAGYGQQQAYSNPYGQPSSGALRESTAFLFLLLFQVIPSNNLTIFLSPLGQSMVVIPRMVMHPCLITANHHRTLPTMIGAMICLLRIGAPIILVEAETVTQCLPRMGRLQARLLNFPVERCLFEMFISIPPSLNFEPCLASLEKLRNSLAVWRSAVSSSLHM